MIKKPNYEPELKQKILRLHLEEGRTQKSLTFEEDKRLCRKLAEKNHHEFGLWLFRQFKVCANGYYDYLKRRKEAHFQRKVEVLWQFVIRGYPHQK